MPNDDPIPDDPKEKDPAFPKKDEQSPLPPSPEQPAPAGAAENRQQPLDSFQLYKQSVEENLRRQMAALGRGGMVIGEDNKGQPNTSPNRGAATPDNQNQGETSAKSIGEIKADEANVSIGENIHQTTNIHYHFESFSRYQQLAPTLLSGNLGEFRTPDVSSDNTDPLQSKFTETFASTSPGTAFVNPEAGSVGHEVQLPDPLDEWYYNTLNEREQCFVQVAAVLHGAPVHEVSRTASELYQPIEEEEKRQQALLLQAESQSPEAIRLATTRPQRASSTVLLLHTHTTTRKIRGAERLLWQDANTSGSSEFGVRVLRFIAREAVLGGSLEQGFLEQLREWPRKFQGECAEKSARALGVIWWGQDMNQLWRLASTWAESDNLQDWRRVAALLQGAYEVESEELGENADLANRSQVLRKISSWVKESHASAKTKLGCAAAYAYGLIGQQSPEQALQGLKQLLRFPQSKGDNNKVNSPLDVFVAGVLGYVTLTLSGHIRAVLAHLAASAEELSHQRQVFQETGERRQYTRQRMISLASIFDAFFFIAASSLTATQRNIPASYSPEEDLPTYPTVPDENGRDVLLAGILAEEEIMWRGYVGTILCAAILEGQDKPPFDLMQQWAEIVLKHQGAKDSELRAAYLQFMVELGKDVNRWCNQIQNSGYRPLPAFDAYKRRLKLWQSNSRLRQSSLGDFAHEVLQQLES